MAEKQCNLLKNGGMQYSTSEQATGDIWIDGKPIYRKVIETTTPATGNSTYPTTANHKNVNIGASTSDIIKIEGFIRFYNGHNRANINTANDNIEWVTVTGRSHTNPSDPDTLRINCGTSWVNCPLKVIVYYTKN